MLKIILSIGSQEKNYLIVNFKFSKEVKKLNFLSFPTLNSTNYPNFLYNPRYEKFRRLIERGKKTEPQAPHVHFINFKKCARPPTLTFFPLKSSGR